MIVKKILAIFILLILIPSCQTTPEKENIQIPSWVANPPQDTSDSFYGIGTGYNLQAANAAALKDASGKLGITVSSIYKQRELITDQGYKKYIDDKVQLSIEDTVISKYQAIKNEALQNQVYSLIKVSKSQIIIDSTEKLNQKNQLANNMLEKRSTLNSLSWHFRAKNLLKSDAEEAYRYASIINLLSQGNSSTVDLSPWKNLNSQVQKNQLTLCIAVINDDRRSKGFVSAFIDVFSKKNIKVTKACSQRILIEGTDSSSYQFTKLQNKFICNASISFTLIEKGRTPLLFSVTAKGMSDDSYKASKTNAINNIVKRIIQQI